MVVETKRKLKAFKLSFMSFAKNPEICNERVRLAPEAGEQRRSRRETGPRKGSVAVSSSIVRSDLDALKCRILPVGLGDNFLHSLS